MTHKVDFSQVYRNKYGEPPPIEGEMLKDSIVNRLTQVPPNLAHEFADGINRGLEEQLVYRDIIFSSASPKLVAHLIDGLSEEQLHRLKVIVANLVMYTGQQQVVNDIVNAVLGVAEITSESTAKAHELYAIVEKMPSETTGTISEAIRLLGNLLTICTVYGMQDMRPHIESRLARMPEVDLDQLISISIAAIEDDNSK